MSLAAEIKAKIFKYKKSVPFTAALFMDLGERSAIDNVLSRLCKQGVIARIAQGVYVKPRLLSDRVELPDLETTLKKKLLALNETIVPHGAEAARKLGLTTQMPTKRVYYTSGPSRELLIRNIPVKLRHAKKQVTQLKNNKVGLAILALLYLGRKNATIDMVTQILHQLDTQELLELKNEIVKQPQWLRDAIFSESK